MFPEYPDFVPLSLDTREEANRLLQSSGAGICELSFATLYLWQDFDRAQFTTINGNLCIHLTPLDEHPFFLEPIGGNEPLDTARKCLAHAGRLSRVTRAYVDSLPAREFKIAEARDHYDYIYRVSDLAELKGRRYDAKRNHIKGLQRIHPEYEYVELKGSHAAEALELFDSWRASKTGAAGSSNVPDLAFDCQRDSLIRAFSAFDDLELFGGAIVAEDRMKAFLIASRLSADTACVHFEYHLPQVDGAAQTIFWESCRTTLAGFAYVNLEQDLGIKGLRKHKISYHPLRLEEKFDVKI